MRTIMEIDPRHPMYATVGLLACMTRTRRGDAGGRRIVDLARPDESVSGEDLVELLLSGRSVGLVLEGDPPCAVGDETLCEWEDGEQETVRLVWWSREKGDDLHAEPTP